MKIAVVGASRGVGRLVVEKALERGFSVRAMSRSIRLEPSASLEVVKGDALVAEDVSQAVQGVDAVIQCVGLRKGPGLLFSTTFFSDATRILVDQMHKAKVSRLVSLTGFGAGDSADFLTGSQGRRFRLFLGRVYADKSFQEQIVRTSSLDWTIVRPGYLHDGPMSDNYEVLVQKLDWRMGRVPRADVADFLLKSVLDESMIGQTPAIQSAL